MTLTLPLDLPEPSDPPEPAPAAAPLSKGRRRTARVAAAVAAGVHPLALIERRVRMHPDADRSASPGDPTGHLRCGSCAHRQPSFHGFPKCDLGPDSNAVTTDVRAWRPACTRYELGTPS